MGHDDTKMSILQKGHRVHLVGSGIANLDTAAYLIKSAKKGDYHVLQ